MDNIVKEDMVSAIRPTPRQMRSLQYQFRQDLRTLIDMKIDIMNRSAFSIIMSNDGTLSTRIYPQETLEALSEIDGYIHDVEQKYKRLASQSPKVSLRPQQRCTGCGNGSYDLRHLGLHRWCADCLARFNLFVQSQVVNHG